MTSTQKIIKYCAIAFAIFLIFSIIAGIASALGIIGTAFVIKETDEIDLLNLSKDAKILDVDLNATNLSIEVGSELKAETNNDNITITEENNRLIIKEKKRSLFNQVDNKNLTIYVPENLIFDGVSIDAGAGNIDINKLNSKNLYLDLGAGNVSISNALVSNKAEIDGGAGKLDINNGSLTNLDLDLGIGDVNLTAILLGRIDIDTGVGSTALNILGNKEDYQIEVDKGIGKVTIDGSNIKDEYRYGTGTNKIDIDGGIGNIDIKFKTN